MSSMYYIGTFKDNIVNKPIEISGIKETCIEDILEYCGINVYEDFNYFTDNKWGLLFYKITEKNRYMLNNNFTDDDFYKDEINTSEFPVVCSGEILQDGNSYHIDNERVILPNYSNFKENELSMKLLDNILKDYSGWENNRSKWFFEEINNTYKAISEWIKNNESIYWWKYI